MGACRTDEINWHGVGCLGGAHFLFLWIGWWSRCVFKFSKLSVVTIKIAWAPYIEMGSNEVRVVLYEINKSSKSVAPLTYRKREHQNKSLASNLLYHQT